MQLPFARFCSECGSPLSFGSIAKETVQRDLRYQCGTLVSYAEVAFVCDLEGQLHALDTALNDLADLILSPKLLPTIAPAAAEGYLYFASSDGIFTVDLTAWLQHRDAKATPLHLSRAISSFAALGDRVSVITSGGGSNQLMAWKGLSATTQTPLSGLLDDLDTVALGLHPGFAFVTQVTTDLVLICDLRENVTTAQRLSGPCLYSSLSRDGVACLIQVDGNRRVVEVSQAGTSVLVPSLPPDTAWFLMGDSPGLYMWGNGNSLTVKTNERQRILKEDGNIGFPIVADGLAIATAQGPVGSAAITIGLSTGIVGYPGRIGDSTFCDIAHVGSRLIVGNGCQIKSIAAE